MSRVRALVAAFSVAVVATFLVPTATATADVPATGSAVADTRIPRVATATGSVLGYQCGEGVCLVDPDVPGAQPVVVVPDGRFAGVTADGRTVAWVQPDGSLVTAPTAGGAPTTVYTGAVGFQPVISPDGASFLWQFAVPVNGFYYTYRLDVATQEVYGISACSCTVTHGWAGPTSIGVFPTDNGRPSRICRLDRSGDSSCVAVLASETRGQLAFPDGSADGQTYVASVDVGGSEFGGVDGPIALFSAATGAVVKDLTSNPNDVTPTLSQEGDRVAFERDDQIVIVDVATGAERVVGPGVYPSWGGTRSQAGGNNAAASVRGTSVKVKAGKIKVKIACAGLGECAGNATLGKGKAVFAKKTYAVTAGKTASVKLKLTKAGKKRFARDGKVKLTLSLRGNGATVKKKVTVRY
jgi:hypothetical protein